LFVIDRCKALERRRALQAEGFGSEITQLRTAIKTLERKFTQIRLSARQRSEEAKLTSEPEFIAVEVCSLGRSTSYIDFNSNFDFSGAGATPKDRRAAQRVGERRTGSHCIRGNGTDRTLCIRFCSDFFYDIFWICQEL
jgi:hypothetical protein